jgi:hypothetical protein
MSRRSLARLMVSLPALGAAVLGGLRECVALWRSRQRRRGAMFRRT